MSRYILLLIFIISADLNSFSQTDTLSKKRKKFYVTWGYTKAWYSKSKIRIKDLSNNYHPQTKRRNYYDVTIHEAVAHDRPDFEKIGDLFNLTIPQFVFRIGYTINNKWDAEVNYDHTKYVVDDWQKVRVSGQISGQKLDRSLILNPDTFVHFEHTDGANFFMINAVRKIVLYKPSKKFAASCVVKAGAGVVIPRTDVTMFGEQLNNDWHLAGWIAGIESGLRIEFLRNGFFELVGKGSYANYMKALVLGKGNGSASHKFWAGQVTATLGIQFYQTTFKEARKRFMDWNHLKKQ